MFSLRFKKSICDQFKKPFTVFHFSIFVKKSAFHFQFTLIFKKKTAYDITNIVERF